MQNISSWGSGYYPYSYRINQELLRNVDIKTFYYGLIVLDHESFIV